MDYIIQVEIFHFGNCFIAFYIRKLTDVKKSIFKNKIFSLWNSQIFVSTATLVTLCLEAGVTHPAIKVR